MCPVRSVTYVSGRSQLSVKTSRSDLLSEQPGFAGIYEIRRRSG